MTSTEHNELAQQALTICGRIVLTAESPAQGQPRDRHTMAEDEIARIEKARTAKPSRRALAVSLDDIGDVVAISLPLILSLSSALALKYFSPYSISSGIVVADTLKLFSIITLMFHTQAALGRLDLSDLPQAPLRSDPMFSYGTVSVIMSLLAIMLSMYIVLLIVPDSTIGHVIVCRNSSNLNTCHPVGGAWAKFMAVSSSISPYIHSQGTCYIVSTVAVSYFPLFLIGNIRFIRLNSQNPSAVRFGRAFIWGVNIPFLSSYICLLTTSAVIEHEGQSLFFSGGVAFLVYGSTAASICIDRLTRPALEESTSDTQNEVAQAPGAAVRFQSEPRWLIGTKASFRTLSALLDAMVLVLLFGGLLVLRRVASRRDD